MKNLLTGKFLLFLFLFFSSFIPGFSQADFVASTGNWSTGGTWGGSTPTSGISGDPTIIQIPAGETVTIANGTDIVLNYAILVIDGELIVANSGFNYSSLTLNEDESAVFVTDGGQITDPSIFGGGNFVRVDGVNFWGGQLFNSFGGSGNPAAHTDDFTSTGETSSSSMISNPLPVVLVSFKLGEENGAVVLEWITASEINNERFEIQRSFDGEHFENVGFVKGHGTTSDIHKYSYSDFISTDAYYRLKQIDYDGGFEYGPLRLAVVSRAIGQKLRLYPNPTSGPLTIEGAITNYALFDQRGNLLLENQNTTSIYAQNEVSKYLTEQKSGVYLFKTVVDGQIQGLRIIKK